ncbi:MAG: hypothetical protein ACI30J_09490 [Paludibacteraceae bacterium]
MAERFVCFCHGRENGEINARAVRSAPSPRLGGAGEFAYVFNFVLLVLPGDRNSI